ncbi:MAG: hypothetical protein H7Z43_03355 [Clostridia bacterium]|nr:hypothetical protein [Deltaproteobacteria bacterium]
MRGKTVSDAERMVVREVPKPAVQSGFRSVFAPTRVHTAASALPLVQSNAVSSAAALSALAVDTLCTDAAEGLMTALPISCNDAQPPPTTMPLTPTTKRAIEPRAVDHYAFRANMNEATQIILREVMDVGNFESYDALFAEGVEALRTELMKKKHAQVEKPRKKTTAPKVEVLREFANSHQVEVFREVEVVQEVEVLHDAAA